MGAQETSRREDASVLIAGGGVGALEASLALQDLTGNRVRIDIYSPCDDFVYRPYSVTGPYHEKRDLRLEMDSISRRCGAHFHRGSIVSVDTERQVAFTHHLQEVPYDYLIVACGARRLRGVPGAINFWGIADDPRLRDVLDDLLERRLRRVIFTMPGGGSWTLPMYELALLARRELVKNSNYEARLGIVTPEQTPLGLFGIEASRKVGELLDAHDIEVYAGTTPVEFKGGSLRVAPRGEIAADAVVSLPRLIGRQIAGIPHDPDGFIPINDRCEIRGVSRAFAVGDVSNFPVKQGGIATQQADVAADVIVADLAGTMPSARFDPILRGVLFTGGEPLYLSGYLAGGHGESSTGSRQPPWQGAEGDKIIGKYLTSFLHAGDAPEPHRQT